MNRARVDFGGPLSGRCGGFSSQVLRVRGEDSTKTGLNGTRKAPRFYSLQAPSLAFATDGSVIATGGTRSSDFPTTPGSPDQTLNGLEDAVVFLLDPTGAALRYGTYLGGWHWDFGYGVEASARGAVVVGRTRSYDFPATDGDFGDTFGGGTCLAGQPCTDAFVAELEISILFIDGFESGDTSAWE